MNRTAVKKHEALGDDSVCSKYPWGNSLQRSEMQLSRKYLRDYMAILLLFARLYKLVEH